MLTFLRKLLALVSAGPVDMFTAGREYAKSQLEEGTNVRELLLQAFNAIDFNDFDRGILSVVNEQEEGSDWQAGGCLVQEQRLQELK